MLKLTFILFIFYTGNVSAKGCKDALKNLLDLYQNQSKQQMLIRVENATDKHKFLRSFIPYYYDRAYEIREAIPVYAKLKNHTGHIVGDAHVENFGFLVDNKGKTKFIMNDFDDTAEAPLFLDVMRLSQSASFVSEVKQSKLIEAYKKGLMNKSRPLSSYTRKLSERSSAGGLTSKAEFTVTEKGPKFSVKAEPIFETTKEEVLSMEKALKDKFKDIKIHDTYRTMKESGGSAFGTRYHALVEIHGKTQMVEFKEIMEGGVVDKWATRKLSEEDRVKNSMNVFLDGFDQNLDVVKLDGKPFQMRMKLEGNKGIDLTKVKASELDEVIQDEFYLLGTLHRTSLGGTEAGISGYAKDLEKVSVQDWEESVKVMKKEIKKIYKDVNK